MATITGATALIAVTAASPLAANADTPAGCSVDGQQYNTGVSTTGAALTPGPFTTDPSWSFSDNATGPSDGTYAPARVPGANPAWADPGTNARWISRSSSGTGSALVNRTMYFKRAITLPTTIDPSTFALSMDFYADNAVSEVWINGVAQSAYAGSGIPQSLNGLYEGFIQSNRAQSLLAQGWQGGANSMVVKVISGGDPSGFLARFAVGNVCPAPRVTIAAPVDGATFALGAAATATFGCLDSDLVTCSAVDDKGDTIVSGGSLDTFAAGSRTLTVTGVDSLGQSTVKSVTYTVDKGTVTVQAGNINTIYGSAVPTVTASYTGFIGDDSAADIDTAPTCSASISASTPAGYYNEATSCSGASDSDYTFDYLAGSATVGKAPLTLTADDKSRTTAEANPALTVTVSGLVNGDTAAVAYSGAPSVTTTATSTSGPGQYPITIEAGTISSGNYDVRYVPGVLTITPAVTYAFTLQQPLNADGSSVVKGNATVPVKFTLKANGIATTTPTAYLSYKKLTSTITGDDLETLATTTPTTGNVFLVSSGQYQYNWSTKGLTSGTYRLTITLDNGASYSVNVSLK
ncbi:MAG: MBG domain-containing protein [Propionibacteriales bacterium]|nr:MBG domain-containing protein [Propionibacteriales bacterium]